MKKIVLVLFACGVAAAWSLLAHPVPVGPGTWDSAAYVDGCDQGRVCAEWVEPGGAMNGAYCCIDTVDLWSTSFSACRVMIRGPRPPGGDMI